MSSEDERFWRNLLQEGVLQMEGATSSGRQELDAADRIFVGCVEGTKGPSAAPLGVKLEATLRRAQCASYAGRKDAAYRLMYEVVRGIRQEAISDRDKAQCLALCAVVLGRHDEEQAASAILFECFCMDFEDHKLQADIANLRAKLIIQRHKSHAPPLKELREAIMFVDMAWEEIEKVPAGDPLANQAKLAILIRLTALHSVRMTHYQQLTRLAFDTLGVTTKSIRARFWEYKAWSAWQALQPVRAVWFMCRALISLL